jgi:hypothetical protein
MTNNLLPCPLKWELANQAPQVWHADGQGGVSYSIAFENNNCAYRLSIFIPTYAEDYELHEFRNKLDGAKEVAQFHHNVMCSTRAPDAEKEHTPWLDWAKRVSEWMTKCVLLQKENEAMRKALDKQTITDILAHAQRLADAMGLIYFYYVGWDGESDLPENWPLDKGKKMSPAEITTKSLAAHAKVIGGKE